MLESAARRTLLQRDETRLKRLIVMLKRCDLGVLVLHDLVQALDRGQRYAIRIYGADVAIIFAQAEGQREILRARPDMLDRRVLALVVPGLNRDACQALQQRALINGAGVLQSPRSPGSRDARWRALPRVRVASVP